MEAKRKRSWSLTPGAFEGLLARLGPDRIKAGEEYERIRQKLFSFFDWRGSSCPDRHVDETLDRIARRLDEGEQVEALLHYAYGVARRILLEWARQQTREVAGRRELHAALTAASPESDRERRLACLDRCLQALPDDGKALIRGYYSAGENSDVESRKRLAERLGVPYGTLKTRAHRVRVRLEICLGQCLGGEAAGTGPGSRSPVDGGGSRSGEP